MPVMQSPTLAEEQTAKRLARKQEIADKKIKKNKKERKNPPRPNKNFAEAVEEAVTQHFHMFCNSQYNPI